MEAGLYQQLFDMLMRYKGIGFVSLQYRSQKTNELSKRLLNVGAKYENAKKEDIKRLAKGIYYIPSDKYSLIDWWTALNEIKTSLVTPSETHSYGQTNAYVYLNDDNHSVKFNPNTLEVYLFAKSERKEILQPGKYEVVNSSPKTLAKQAIQKEYLKTGKFRTFKLKNVRGTVKVNGQVLEIVVDENL